MRSWPRPANASPKPVSASCEFCWVFVSNVFRKSSNSTGCPACASGIVSPCLNVCLEWPGVSSMYFRPRAERGRTITRVSLASGWTVLSSFMCTIAIVRVCPLTLPMPGLILSIRPTRKPPTRTSLLLTRLAPLGSSALTSYVGTNGRPWFAL